ncbi:hypothetical protein NL676_015779 [Syzygium grande]|nr:hypothetical protein NL676_015779 [Syzygium grande]
MRSINDTGRRYNENKPKVTFLLNRTKQESSKTSSDDAHFPEILNKDRHPRSIESGVCPRPRPNTSSTNPNEGHAAIDPRSPVAVPVAVAIRPSINRPTDPKSADSAVESKIRDLCRVLR